MGTKKKIVVVVGAAFLCILCLVVLLSKAMSQGGKTSSGLFKGGNSGEEVISPSSELGIWEEPDETVTVEALMYSYRTAIRLNLPAGKFDNLETWIIRALDKERDRFSKKEISVLESYLADIAFYKSVISADEDANVVTEWRFENPDVLAAAIAFAPVSDKYQAILHRDSVVFPPAKGDVELALADLTEEEIQEKLDAINATRTKDNEFSAIKVFSMKLFNRDCEFVAVADSKTRRWYPYSLACVPPTNDPTVEFIYGMIESQPGVDIDAIYKIG